jgi:hypothetical protein
MTRRRKFRVKASNAPGRRSSRGTPENSNGRQVPDQIQRLFACGRPKHHGILSKLESNAAKGIYETGKMSDAAIILYFYCDIGRAFICRLSVEQGVVWQHDGDCDECACLNRLCRSTNRSVARSDARAEADLAGSHQGRAFGFIHGF